MSHLSAWANDLLRSNAVILDTETTGVDKAAQVIQLSIIDMGGKTLFDSLFRPSCDIHPTATATHHLTKYRLRNAPLFSDAHEALIGILNGRSVIAYNYSFDKRMLMQTALAFKLDAARFEQLGWLCAMRAHAEHLGVKNSPKLEGGNHTALSDCLAVLRLLHDTADANSAEQKTGSLTAEQLRPLAPTKRTLDHLEKVYAAQQARGEDVAAELRWLKVWRDIRSNLVDGAASETRKEVGLLTKREGASA